MERFREHEKEFKTKKFSIKGLQKGQRDRGDNYSESDYGSENINEDGDDQETLDR